MAKSELDEELRKARERAERHARNMPSYLDAPVPEGLDMSGVLCGGAPPEDRRYREPRAKSAKG